MKTQLTITIEHPDGTDPSDLIQLVIYDHLESSNSVLANGWSIKYKQQKEENKMSKEQLERYAYFISFSHHLSDFDHEMHRDDVLVTIEKEEACVWEPFENFSKYELLDSVYNLANHIMEMFGND